MARREGAAMRTARALPSGPGETRLRVDPSVCDGIGICAHLAPDLVALDSWGYPVLDGQPLASASELRRAGAAATACPRRALYLES